MASRGRPLKFKSVKSLQEQIDKYFNATPVKKWTITGLAIALDTDRQTLINYENKAEYFDTIKKAKLMVENSYEIDLKEKGNTGTIFALKNFGWQDKQEIETKDTTTSYMFREITAEEYLKAKKEKDEGD